MTKPMTPKQQKLFLSLQDLVREMTAISRSTGIEYDDRMQAARIGLWRACRKWRPDGGANPRTYAIWWIRSELSLLSKYAHAKHRWSSQPILSLDAELGEEGSMTLHEVVPCDDPTPEDDILTSGHKDELYASAADIPRQRGWKGNAFTASEIAELMIEKGYNQVEVAQHYGVSRERIRQVVKKIRAEARESAA